MVMRFVLNQDIMRTRYLTPPMIRCILAERLGSRASVCSSDTSSIDWTVRIRLHHVKDMLAHGNLGPECDAVLCHRVMNVLLDTVVIGGHPGVTNANVAEERGEYVVYTYGSWFLACSAYEAVDWYRTTADDVWEVYHTLGIEACAHVYFEQIKSVVSFDGTYVDDRHILLIVDSICRSGSVMPLNRHGLNRVDTTSPFMRCSFEETTDVLCDAAMFAQQENALGVSTSIMMGQLGKFGTGGVEMQFSTAPAVKVSSSDRARTMRSTCRSFTKRTEEQIEYVLDSETRLVSARRMSPPTVPAHVPRKRTRFRNASPPEKR